MSQVPLISEGFFNLLYRPLNEIAVKNVRIEAYPDGWPKEPAVLENALTIVWYFDGLESHPLLDAKRRAQFKRLMTKGVGLVALHQAFTLLPDDTLDLPNWLGGARYGMFDRANEKVDFEPATHPISRGVGPFSYQDEFYPTIHFASEPRKIVPILTARMHVQPQPEKSEPLIRPVAWAFERQEGGRSFGFTGLHYLFALEHQQLRTLLLNAIVWTAGIEVPEEGIRSGLSATVSIESQRKESAQKTITKAMVRRLADYKVIAQPWGSLTWYVSGELGNSNTMTVGRAIIKRGQQSPRHLHPNCDEVLHVIEGHIRHTMDDTTVELLAGDTVSIPAGTRHNAANIGTDDAVLEISFSSADRQVVGE